jgi:hypothetical protein
MNTPGYGVSLYPAKAVDRKILVTISRLRLRPNSEYE